jgi:hypothetical protein
LSLYCALQTPDGIKHDTIVALSDAHALEIFSEKFGLTLSFSPPGESGYLFCSRTEHGPTWVHPNIPVFATPVPPA